ncbi:hypothetical protein LUX33_37455 [Actinomadura madurae]|nr:hypothetical protein [Actinomadura madurae]MCP9953566.1 hypothetical protein [Actinomadura madurae]MCP9970323.1 hypothetical protein [Actinomadura madurae]MCP9982800.1 hypothetical protein [Actinomadura madurae]
MPAAADGAARSGPSVSNRQRGRPVAASRPCRRPDASPANASPSATVTPPVTWPPMSRLHRTAPVAASRACTWWAPAL